MRENLNFAFFDLFSIHIRVDGIEVVILIFVSVHFSVFNLEFMDSSLQFLDLLHVVVFDLN